VNVGNETVDAFSCCAVMLEHSAHIQTFRLYSHWQRVQVLYR